jgi:hypothetical protein
VKGERDIYEVAYFAGCRIFFDKKEKFGINVDHIKTKQLTDYLIANEKLELDDEDKQATPSASTKDPRIFRRFRNLNSNKRMYRLGLFVRVEDKNGKFKGFLPVLDEEGKPFSKAKVTATIEKDNPKLKEYSSLLGGYVVTSKETEQNTTNACDPRIKKLTLRRAGGRCECCEIEGFEKKNGDNYLEVHHIHDKDLTESTAEMPNEKTDHIDYVAAICPSCHMYCHHGKDGKKVNQRLLKKIQKNNELYKMKRMDIMEETEYLEELDILRSIKLL